MEILQNNSVHRCLLLSWIPGHPYSRSSVQFNSVIQLSPTLCDTMDYSTPGFPLHHQLPELAQTHVHWVNNAIQSSHPLSSLSPAINISQHQSLFQWVQFFTWSGQSIGASASVLLNIQDWFPLGLIGWLSLMPKGLPTVFPNTTVQKHQFFSAHLS